MTHIIMLSLGIFLYIVTRRLFYKNIELFICLLIPVNFEFFHLLPRIGQYDNYREALLVILFLHLVEFYFLRPVVVGRKKNPRQSHFFTYLVFGYLALVVNGVITAMFAGQSLVLGIQAMMFQLTILVFFLIAYRDFNIYKFLDYLFILIGCLGLLLVIQYIMFDYYHFFHFYKDTDTHVRDLNELRGLRLVEGVELIAICSVAAFTRFMQSEKMRYLLAFLFFFCVIVFVAKYRAYILSIPVACFIIYFLYHGLHPRVILLTGLVLLIVPVLVLVLVNTPAIMEHQIVKSVAKDIEGITAGHGNLSIRLLCYQYYYTDTVNNHLWLGRGILNNNWEGNPTGKLIRTLAIYLSDIGVFHIFVNFGLLGVFYTLFLFASVFRLGIKYRLAMPLVSYFILGIIFSFEIDIFFYDYLIFVLGIFLGLLQVNLTAKQTRIRKN